MTKKASGSESSGRSEDPGAKGVVLLGDDPVAGLAGDAFGRGPFADRVVQLLDNLAEETPSAVLGLLGPWGSGKTSVLNVLREKLDGHGDWQVVDLNPWMVADVPSMIDEFFITLVSKLPSTKKGNAVRKKMAGYAGAVAPVTSVLKVVGVDAESALRGVEDMLKGDQSLESRRKELEEALRAYGQPVLMIADDLDRLQPDELLLVFKLVRLLGRLPNTYYLLAFDERTATDVIGATDLARGDPGRAHAYLEKVIQIRLDMPVVRPKQVTNLVNSLLQAVCTRHAVDLDSEASNRLSEAFRVHMSEQMTQPRQVKRYFAQLEAMWPLVADEVDFVDFAIIVFLRTFHPPVVDVLIRHRAELTRTSWDVAFERPSHEVVADRWRQRLAATNLSPADVGSLLRLLSSPFLVIHGAMQRMEYSGFGAERAEQKRVDSIEYFDRYFHLGVGDGEVADATVHKALGELVAGDPGHNWATILKAIEGDAEYVYSKLSRFAPKDPASAEILAPRIAELAKLAADPSDFFGPPLHVRHWLSETIEHARPVDIDAFIDNLADLAGTTTVVYAANSLRRRANDLPEERPSTVDAVLTASAKRLVSELELQATRSPAKTQDVIELLIMWTALDSTANPKAWMTRVVGSGRWPARDVLGLFTPLHSSSDGTVAILTLGEPDLARLEALLGIDFVAAQLDSLPAGDTPDKFDETDVSFDNRIRRTEMFLANELKNRAGRPSASETTPTPGRASQPLSTDQESEVDATPTEDGPLDGAPHSPSATTEVDGS